MGTLLGIDEAGRGPIIGPLVMAGVIIDEKDEGKLKKLGVKDSKKLTPKRREELFSDVKRLAKNFRIVVVPVEEVDRAVTSETSNLNKLEGEKAAEIISLLKPDHAILDAPGHNTAAFKEFVLSKTSHKNVKVTSENKADDTYPVVSAASILAKVVRDKEIDKLKKKMGVDFGSGYMSDPFTMAFFKENFDKYPIFRKSWAPYKELTMKKNQTTLSGF